MYSPILDQGDMSSPQLNTLPPLRQASKIPLIQLLPRSDEAEVTKETIHDDSTIPNKIKPRFWTGWRRSVSFCIAGAVLVCIVNISLTVVAVTKYAIHGGVGTIYMGDCGLVHKWNTVLHLSINVLSTCLLAASNFTMQCLSSPTRTEVDTAHGRRQPLDIGIPSFKNLSCVRPIKAVIWWGLALSSLPLHLLWNSSAFSTIGANKISYIVVDESFFAGTSIPTIKVIPTTCGEVEDLPPLDSFHTGYQQGRYSQPLTPSECIKAYAEPFLTSRRNMIAVTRPEPGIRQSPSCLWEGSRSTVPIWNGSSILAISDEGSNIFLYSSRYNYHWLCNGYDDFGLNDFCTGEIALSQLTKNGSWYLRPHDVVRTQSYKIEYCLSETEVPQTCQLQFVSSILYIVIACNVVKVVCMGLTLYLLQSLDEPILATVGDAITSFMQQEDTTTRGWGLLDQFRVKEWQSVKRDLEIDGSQYSGIRTKRMFSATSRRRWFTTTGLCLFYVVVGIFLLRISLDLPLEALSLSQIWRIGFGSLSPYAIIQQEMIKSSLIRSILIANSFQLALSLTYLLYNSLFTARYGALEWAAYASGNRKSLRVSYPQGQQRSTFWLQLPYKYGVPLILMSTIMHFLLSQSVFLANVNWYGTDRTHSIFPHHFQVSSIGYSPLAILVTICIGAMLVLVQVLHSFRPLRSAIPIHGNSSVVISAMCHPFYNPASGKEIEVDVGAPLEPIMWGAVIQPGDEHEIGHCSFTNEAVELPIPGRKYN